MAPPRRTITSSAAIRRPQPWWERLGVAAGHSSLLLAVIALVTGEVEWFGWFVLTFLVLVSIELGITLANRRRQSRGPA